MSFQPDGQKYRELSEPVTKDEAAENLKQFYEAVGAAREQFHVADVLIIVAVNVQYDNGEGQAMTYHQWGDTAKSEGMAAYAYGQEQQSRKEMMNRLLLGKNE